jgi:hypothetical protein
MCRHCDTWLAKGGDLLSRRKRDLLVACMEDFMGSLQDSVSIKRGRGDLA